MRSYLYSWCFVDMKGGMGIKHCFLGGGARKVPCTPLRKAEKLRKDGPSELHFDKFNKLLGSKSIVQERRKG